MARRTKAEAERTRRRIVRAALDLFITKGYERATFEDIGKRIKLTKGAVYYHFRSKPDLLTEVVKWMAERHSRQVARALPCVTTLHTPEALRAHFVERALLVTGTPLNRRYFQMLRRLDWPSAKFDFLRDYIRGMASGPCAIIKTALATMREQGAVYADADIVEAAEILFVLWLGLVELSLNGYLECDLESAVARGFDAVLDKLERRVG